MPSIILTLRYAFNIMIIALTVCNNVIGQTKFDRKADISLINQKIVFESNRDENPSELYLSNINGSETIRLTNNSSIEGSPKWSPNGKSIIYYSIEDLSSGNFDIILLDIQTNKIRKITSYQGLDMAPIWSPNGQKIYYSSRKEMDELRVFDLDKETDELVMNNIEHHYGISFSPDGNKFVAVRVYEKNWDIVIVDLKTKIILNRFEHDARENNPIWSPDGQTIYFASNRSDLWQIYSMDINGNNIRNLTKGFGNSRFFTLSPTGEDIYFTLTKLGSDDIMYKMNIDGSDKTKINFRK